MDYSLNIVTSVKGQARLDATLKSIGQIRSLARDIKPLNLLAPGAGKAGDEIRKARTELDKLGREATNNTAKFSNTFGGAKSQAQAFAIALENVGLKLSLPFDKQAAEVKNYANALAQAEAKAEKLGKLQNEIIRDARQRAGVAIGPASQLGSPEALAQQVRFEANQINRVNQLRKEQLDLVNRISILGSKNVQTGQLTSQVARINLALDEKRVDEAEELTEELQKQIRHNETLVRQSKKKAGNAGEESDSASKTTRTLGQRIEDAAQGAILGGGFPLLFGGPSFSAFGGLLGGGLAGGIGGQKASFAGGILGSVLGQPFDAITKSALELGKALESPTKNIQQLVDVLPLAGSKTKGLIGDLQELGLDSAAGALAVQELNDQLGALGLQDVNKLKEGTDALSNAFKELKLLGIAFAAPGLVNGVKILTKLIVGIKQDQGFLARATRATLSFLTRSDATADFNAGKGPFKNTPQATLETLQEQNKINPLTERQLQVQELINSFRERSVEIANIQATIEFNRLNLIRGELQVVQTALQVDRAKLAFDKAALNVSAESNESEKARLIVKRDLAKAALDEARAAKLNADELARQAQAAYELEQRQKSQAIVLGEMQQRTAADQAIRGTSPFAQERFLLDPFFGRSAQLKTEQGLRYAETLKILNEQIHQNNVNMKMGANLSDQEFKALVEKEVALQRQLSLYQELQPEMDEAALAQARFTEALAITVPVTDALFDNLLSVVEGTKTAEEAFADFLRSISSMLFDAAKQIIATYSAIGLVRSFAFGGNSGVSTDSFAGVPNSVLDSVIGQRALGGAVGAGRPYLVGERGPELFVPGAQGNIVPNNAMGGANVVVNVDASGTQAQGNQPNAKALGAAIGAAVQAELVKQKRPGGLLS